MGAPHIDYIGLRPHPPTYELGFAKEVGFAKLKESPQRA